MSDIAHEMIWDAEVVDSRKVVNIVASIELGDWIDLEKISASFENVMYEPKMFLGIV